MPQNKDLIRLPARKSPDSYRDCAVTPISTHRCRAVLKADTFGREFVPDLNAKVATRGDRLRGRLGTRFATRAPDSFVGTAGEAYKGMYPAGHDSVRR
jgi:hypothetical protein